MCKLKNYKDGRRLLWSRFKSGNVKQFINTIKYRFKYGFFYSETWNLGHDISEYILKRLWQYYETGHVPSFITNQDMNDQGFNIDQTLGEQYTSDQYIACWKRILTNIQVYLYINTKSSNWILTDLDARYVKGSIYLGKYLSYLSI